MSLPKTPFRGFRRPKGVLGTSGRPVNIDFRFLRIFLRIDALIRNWFQGGARYPLLPTRLYPIFFIPDSIMSRRQVFLGRPLFFFPCGFPVRACLVMSDWDILRVWLWHALFYYGHLLDTRLRAIPLSWRQLYNRSGRRLWVNGFTFSKLDSSSRPYHNCVTIA